MDAQDELLVTIVRRLEAAGDWPTSYRVAQEWTEPPHLLHDRLERLFAAGWLTKRQSESPGIEGEYYAPGPQAPPS